MLVGLTINVIVVLNYIMQIIFIFYWLEQSACRQNRRVAPINNVIVKFQVQSKTGTLFVLNIATEPWQPSQHNHANLILTHI